MKTTIISVAILCSIGTLYFFWSQNKIDRMQDNLIKYEQSISRQDEVIDSLKRDIDHIKEASKEITEIREDIKRKEIRLEKTFSGHDFNKIAKKKPKLLEKIINKASDDRLRCFELLSGVEINPSDRNNKLCQELVQ